MDTAPHGDTPLNNPDRLAALRRSGLMDAAPEERLDRLVRLARRALRVPVALVSLVDDRRQFFKSAAGLPEPWASARQTPLSHSFCQHVVRTGRPLVVDDARTDPLVRENLAVPDLGVVAYAGMPLTSPEGHVLGSFCAIDGKARRWSAEELEVLRDLAASVTTEIVLQAARDEAEAAGRAKDRFLAVLSHELRTPLSPALMLSASMANDPALPPGAREDARTIKRNIEFQTRLIDDLLDLSRVQTGKLSLRDEPVDLAAVVGECAAAFAAEAHEKGVVLAADVGAAGGLVVRGDAHRLRQVFQNVLKNAVKFTPSGGRITLRAQDAGGGRVAVAVTDTGVGIDPAGLPAVFDAFEQGGGAVTRHYGGLGLGLAICKALVEGHGGTIAVESEGVGRGATVTVHLPADATDRQPDARGLATPSPAQGAGTPPTPTAGDGLRILLVEDHQDTLRVMARLLRGLRHRVVAADCVAAARAAAGREPFDVVISDIGLPDGSGLDLMRGLRRDAGAGAGAGAGGRLRGIALTGYGAESDLRDTIEAGFTSHLTKPVDFGELERTLRAMRGH